VRHSKVEFIKERRLGRIKVSGSFLRKEPEVISKFLLKFIPVKVDYDYIQDEFVYIGYHPEFEETQEGSNVSEYYAQVSVRRNIMVDTVSIQFKKSRTACWVKQSFAFLEKGESMFDRRLSRVLVILQQLDLDSLNKKQKPRSVFNLADIVCVSHSYAEKILQELKSFDLVTGHKGPGGGYRINESRLRDLTIGELCSLLGVTSKRYSLNIDNILDLKVYSILKP